MIETITTVKFKTSDGQEFDTELEALREEVEIQHSQSLLAICTAAQLSNIVEHARRRSGTSISDLLGFTNELYKLIAVPVNAEDSPVLNAEQSVGAVWKAALDYSAEVGVATSYSNPARVQKAIDKCGMEKMLYGIAVRLSLIKPTAS